MRSDTRSDWLVDKLCAIIGEAVGDAGVAIHPRAVFKGAESILAEMDRFALAVPPVDLARLAAFDVAPDDMDAATRLMATQTVCNFCGFVGTIAGPYHDCKGGKLATPPLSAAGGEVVILSPGELIDDMPELGALSTFRGHPTRWDGEGWRYVDTGELIYGTWESRPCGHCLRYPTPEGHDPCLGTLPGVRNACCGHGHRESAYVQFDNGVELRGFAAPVAFVRPVAGRAEVLKSAQTYSQDIPDSAAAGSAERERVAKELLAIYQDEMEEGDTLMYRRSWVHLPPEQREAWCKDADRILAALREEGSAERDLLTVMEEEHWTVRSVDVPTGGDDSDVAWEVVEHYMAEPQERVIATGETPRAALIAALRGQGEL